MEGTYKNNKMKYNLLVLFKFVCEMHSFVILTCFFIFLVFNNLLLHFLAWDNQFSENDLFAVKVWEKRVFVLKFKSHK